jgi:hypothetical protein
VWYRDALSKYLREILLDRQTLSRSYLEPRGVEAIVNGHLKGDRNYTTEIHKLLTLELLHRLFIDPSGQCRVMSDENPSWRSQTQRSDSRNVIAFTL